MANEKMNEMRQMVDQLNRAAEAYYNGRGELMTDFEWDALFDRLKRLEAETGVILEDSPTHHVSADSVVGQKEAHEFPALSLAKTKQVTDLAKWAEGRPVWLSWKLDGLTLVVTFDDGRLTKVVTRGDGHIGTNITHLAAAIGGIPQTIPSKGHIVIRGECVISYADFEQFLLESDEDYANPRNLASGSLTLKDIDEVRQRHLQWIPFTLVHVDEDIPSWGARMDFIKENGMTPVEHELITDPTVDHLQEAIDRWTLRVTGGKEGRKAKDLNPYPVDGLVLAYDDYAYSLTGSVTGHHATRAGYAFKWADEQAPTTLDHIEWSCAASTISPVAVFKPVDLEGTVVKRASLCNISECERLGIGGKGTEMKVIKANKIIPKVVAVTHAVGDLEIPAVCPVCGAPTKVVTSAVSGTKTLHCTNPACPAKQLRKFTRFVSKAGMNIDGISEQTIARFVNRGWIREYADFYRLGSYRQEMAAMDGFGQKSALNIQRAVEKSRTEAEARRFLYALNIPLVGQDVCKRLLAQYPLEKLIAIAAGRSEEQVPQLQFDGLEGHEGVFATIPGIGPEKSAAVVRWFSDPDNYGMVERLVEVLGGYGAIKQESGEPQGALCQGLTFVITGDVHHYKNRNALKAYIESQGGKCTGSVSKSTSYLINNDVTSTSSKNQKAHQLNIPIISEDEFVRRFTEGQA